MSGRIFLDTKILIYAYSHTDIAKRDIARDLIRVHTSVLSTQVLQELSNTLSRKFNQPWQAIQTVLEETSLGRRGLVSLNRRGVVSLDRSPSTISHFSRERSN